MPFSPRRLADAVGLVTLVSSIMLIPAQTLHAQVSGAAGGFTDSATSVGLRPTLSAAEIRTFLPDRGVFTFPTPYSTQGVRLTTSSDCAGADCVLPVGNSYWSNINNHVGSDTMLIFLGLERRKGGGGPTLFSFNKRTGETVNRGPLFPSDSPLSWSTGEGWYFSATQPTMLYVNSGPRMLRYDVQSQQTTTVFDVSVQFGTDKYLWQLHSSNDDRVHSATLRQDGSYEMLGCVVYGEGTGRLAYFPKKGDFDECQIDKSGRWLVIKENVDGRDGEDNRIIDLQTGSEQVLTDPNGAGGHSDIGFGSMIAEDNWNAEPGAVRRWNFGLDMQGGQPARVQGQGELVYKLSSWASGLGHVAYGDAQANTPIERQVACASNASRQVLPRVNEIVCFPLDGSLRTLIVAPNLTDLNAAGGGSDDYSKLPKGNLDVTGEYFIWTANAGTSRLDAYLVRIPRLTGDANLSSATPDPMPDAPPDPMAGPTPDASPEPAPELAFSPSPSPAPPQMSTAAVRWMSLVNLTATEYDLRKTSGCGGCPDAGAVSEQQVSSGNGVLSFSTPDTQTLRLIGLGFGAIGTAPTDIAFALRLQGGTAEVREAGVYKSEVSFEAGDVLQVVVDGGAVSYAKNGEVFYASQATARYPLSVNATFFDLDATLSSVTLSER